MPASLKIIFFSSESEIDQDYTIFSSVTYLGAAIINAPNSDIEILRNICELNSTSDISTVGVKISISIPLCAEGIVV